MLEDLIPIRLRRQIFLLPLPHVNRPNTDHCDKGHYQNSRDGNGFIYINATLSCVA